MRPLVHMSCGDREEDENNQDDCVSLHNSDSLLNFE